MEHQAEAHQTHGHGPCILSHYIPTPPLANPQPPLSAVLSAGVGGVRITHRASATRHGGRAGALIACQFGTPPLPPRRETRMIDGNLIRSQCHTDTGRERVRWRVTHSRIRDEGDTPAAVCRRAY